jgi:hypothetical protein
MDVEMRAALPIRERSCGKPAFPSLQIRTLGQTYKLHRFSASEAAVDHKVYPPPAKDELTQLAPSAHCYEGGCRTRRTSAVMTI